MIKSLITLIVVFFIVSCSSSGKVMVKDEQKKANPYDESFDPNSLNDDDIVAGYSVASKSNNKDKKETSVSQENPQFREVKGFRVQILATKSIEAATLAEQEAKDLFDNMHQKIYLIFDAPLYKLRVGDVTSKDEAEEIRDVAKDYGYREAFIVPSKVNISTTDSQ